MRLFKPHFKTMNSFFSKLGTGLAGILFASQPITFGQSANLGIFSHHADIGRVGRPGSVQYEAAGGRYLVAGGGENMWFTNDAFHYVWKQATGDLSLAADIRLVGTNGNAHRKAGLVIRQSLDADSAYVDAVVHGNGLTSIQYRETSGGLTREVQANVSKPGRVRIEKRGDYVSLSAGDAGGAVEPTGGSFRLRFTEPFYVGLGVCAHDNTASEQAEFSNLELRAEHASPPPTNRAQIKVRSTLEVVPIASGDRRVVYHTRDHIEAPNWSRDGKYFLFNREGRICKLPVEGGRPEVLDTGVATHCNNDHGISPDGTQLAISDQAKDGRSRIYLSPIAGGTPRLVTSNGPSYWHGWSPDGQTLAYCAERKGEFDVYTTPAAGGEERRLTFSPGLDDGPDYSPDGKYIYFNSVRSGLMQIWRMKADGTEPEQLTKDDFNNWFAHPSPDGKWLVFVTFEKDVTGHPANQEVMLRLMPAGGGEIKVLAKLFGGQGTMNVPSWSPDSRSVAFVSYQPVEP